MPEVSLEDVLRAREERVMHQQDMLKRHHRPLVCFTMNIAGPVKVNEETAYAFRVGSVRLLEGLKTMGFDVLEKQDISTAAGYGIILSVNAPSGAVKKLCVSLEELDPLGRLFDMDVISENGEKLDRDHERCCLVCGQAGRGCASRRIHSVEQIQQVTWNLIRDHRTQAQSEQIARLAVQSLLDEVCVTPKPGLVDRMDQGSHRDMDIFTFNASAAALEPYFRKCYLSGVRDRLESAGTAFTHLQTLGIEAERVMRTVTQNVNTHKGAIYTLGLMCGAAGMTEKADLQAWIDDWYNVDLFADSVERLTDSYDSTYYRGKIEVGGKKKWVYIWYDYSLQKNKRHATMKFTALVPAGYDGVVVGVSSAGVDSEKRIYEVYDKKNFLLLYMK